MNPATILVVEDNDTTRNLLRVCLEAEGYQVLEAGDGRAALDHIRQTVPQIVLQDLELPDMNGLDLILELRATPGGETVPILALSGFFSELDEAQAEKWGFTGFLVKPIDPSRLVETIQQYLPNPSPGRLGRRRRVVIADDNVVQLKLLHTLLTAEEFDVVVAGDGEEALRAALAAPPDAIISDVLMPALDGFGLCSAVRREPALAAIPVILVSAYFCEESDGKLARKVGANRLVPRSSTMQEVMDSLVELLDAPPSLSPPADTFADEHVHRLLRQLERQVDANTDFRQRGAMQAAQLSLFTTLCEGAAQQDGLDQGLKQALDMCLDAAGISRGILFVRFGGVLLLRHAIGYASDVAAELNELVARLPLVAEVTAQEAIVALRSGDAGGGAGELLSRLGVRNALLVPLVAPHESLGLLLLASDFADVTTGDSMAFGRFLGTQVSQALRLHLTIARLARSEERFRRIVETTREGVWTIDAQGATTFVNQRMADMLGWSAEEIIGRRVTEFVDAEVREDTEQRVQRNRTGVMESREAELRRKDGSELLVRVTSDPILDEQGQFLEGLAIVSDITQEKRAQAQLLAADRLASIGMLAAGVAHEINNPLAVLMANLDMAVADLGTAVPADSDHDAAGLLRDARDAAERIRLIVRDLRGLSRVDDVRTSVDVEHVIDFSARMAGNEIRLRAVLVKRYGHPPLVKANEAKLGQVVLNLLVNAAQAIPKGNVEGNQIVVETGVEDRQVYVAITDTGEGMEADVLHQLFTPFLTTKPIGQGTGLGLSICHQIVTGFGGTIAVQSQPGRGTTFRVILPIAPSEDAAASAAPAPKPAPAMRARILFIDDEPEVCVAVRRLLHEHEIIGINDGEQALARLASGEQFDVILCNLIMPHVTGMDVHAALTKRAPEDADRIIFMSGGAFTPRARRFLEQVPNQRIEKPFDAEILRAAIEVQVRARRGNEATRG